MVKKVRESVPGASSARRAASWMVAGATPAYTPMETATSCSYTARAISSRPKPTWRKYIPPMASRYSTPSTSVNDTPLDDTGMAGPPSSSS
jgi:hypothetical protein